jgi:hypothetical protein
MQHYKATDKMTACDHDDFDGMCSVTSTDMTDSVVSSSNSSSMDDTDDNVSCPQHRIYIFEFALGQEVEENDALSISSQPHNYSPYMWRRSYITESSSTISDLSDESNVEDHHDHDPELILKEDPYHKRSLRPKMTRFLPKVMQRSIERINAMRPLAGRSR